MNKKEESPLTDIMFAFSSLAAAVANQLDAPRLSTDLTQIRQMTLKHSDAGKMYCAMMDNALALLQKVHIEEPPKRH